MEIDLCNTGWIGHSHECLDLKIPTVGGNRLESTRCWKWSTRFLGRKEPPKKHGFWRLFVRGFEKPTNLAILKPVFWDFTFMTSLFMKQINQNLMNLTVVRLQVSFATASPNFAAEIGAHFQQVPFLRSSPCSSSQPRSYANRQSTFAVTLALYFEVIGNKVWRSAN